MTMAVAQANSLFSAKLASWKSTSGPAHPHVRSVGTTRIPVELAAHVDYVAGLAEPFPTLQSKPLTRAGDRVPDAATQPCLYEPGPTPDCLFDAYGIPATGYRVRILIVKLNGSVY